MLTHDSLRVCDPWPSAKFDDACAQLASDGTDAQPDPHAGRMFGTRYRIERMLGQGGMGVVYLARHRAINKLVAIKVLHATKDPDVVARFEAEARAASSIGNEHIVDVIDFAELPDGSTYFVMEFLDGVPLSKLLRERGPLPTSRLIRIALQIADGLRAAHANGIVHRDLKPDNVFLCKRYPREDFVKIVDFGIAKVTQGANTVTAAGRVFGTPQYMSPEQAAGLAVDQRSDIYSLGAMLYEASVGCVPFAADTTLGVLSQHLHVAPVPPRAHPACPGEFSPGLEAIILRCLRKDPAERFSSMAELAADLERLARGEVPTAVKIMLSLSEHSPAYVLNALETWSELRTGESSRGGTRNGRPRAGRIPDLWALFAILLGMTGMAVGLGLYSWRAREPSLGSAHEALFAPMPAVVATPGTESVTSAASVARTTQAALTRGLDLGEVVLISSRTARAHVFAGGRDLGETPINVPRPEPGHPTTLTVRAPGHADQTLKIEASSANKILVELSDLRTTVTSRPYPQHPSYPSRAVGPMPAPTATPTRSKVVPDDPWSPRRPR